MTDFKVGDKVRAVRDSKGPHIKYVQPRGTLREVLEVYASSYPWIRLTDPGEESTHWYEAKDFELAPTESRSSDFNKGDRVTCNSSRSYYATNMVEGVYTVAYTTETWRGVPLVALNEGVYMVEPSTLSHVPKASNVETVKKPASPPGWTFRAAPSDFDGPRILRELEAQGAQYAVIVWGKGEDERIAVVSQGLFDRMDKLPDFTLPNAVGTSYYRVTDFGPGKQLVEDASETVAGWHESKRADGTPCRLGDLKALAGRVEAWEQANSEVRVYVAYGQAGDK